MSLINGSNFIFIHIYKCAGMSLRKAISDNISSIEINQSHSTAKEMKEYCYTNGGQFFWDTAFKFSFVRNPFDWVVSLYEFIRGNPNHANYEEIKDMDFKQFCQWNVDCINNKKINPNGSFNTLTSFICDDDGKLLVDFVGRFENIEEDFKIICNRLKIPEIEIQKINPSNREPDYRKYYDEESKAIISEGFYMDLVNFNYTF